MRPSALAFCLSACVAAAALPVRSAHARTLSQFEAVLIAAAGGVVVGSVWFNTRQSAWNTWWETASYTAGIFGGLTLVFWEDPPPAGDIRRPERRHARLPGRTLHAPAEDRPVRPPIAFALSCTGRPGEFSSYAAGVRMSF